MLKFFDKLEDRIRGFLSKYPILYALIAAVSIVVFWRSVWELADAFLLSPTFSLVVSTIVLMVTGVFVSFFIGDRIILSGLKHEKKIEEKTEAEVREEESILERVLARLDAIEWKLSSIMEEERKKK